MSGAENLVEKILRGIESEFSESDDEVPRWSPTRLEPSSAYVRRAGAYAERVRREVENEREIGISPRASVNPSSKDARVEDGVDLSARFARAANASVRDGDADASFVEELRSNLPSGDPLRVRGGRKRATINVSASKSPRGVSGRAMSALGASREHMEALASELTRERTSHAHTRKKYEDLGAHASAVLRQRDEAREQANAATERERVANARVEELARRLDEERAASKERLEEITASGTAWREAQMVEINALRDAAEMRMREVNEASAHVEERIAARVGHYEKLVADAERDAVKRARESLGRFGALASSREVQAQREVSALRARVEELEDACATANRERSSAQHAHNAVKRDMEETTVQIESFRVELTNARDVIHARDEALGSARRDLRNAEGERDEARAKINRLEIANRDLTVKVSSLEEVLGDVGGHKRSIMILRARIAHLTSETRRAKEIAITMRETVSKDVEALREACARDASEALDITTKYYEARLRASSEERVIQLIRQVKRLEDEITDLKRVHALEIEQVIETERSAAANTSEKSIRSSTQRSIEAEKAKAVAEMSAREAHARAEVLVKERDAMEETLVAANEHVAQLKAERSTFEEKLQNMKRKLEESEANVQDLGRLLSARGRSSDEDDDGSERFKLDSSAASAAVEALKKQLEDARAETARAVKLAEETAQLEIEAIKRGMEMSSRRARDETEQRIAELERELRVALETKKVAFEELQELRTQIERYEALTRLQDEAMSSSKSQVKSLSQRLMSLETSVSGSPTPTSPARSPASTTRSRSFFVTPGSISSFTPGSPVARPAPTPLTVARPLRSPGVSPIKPKSPLFRNLHDDLGDDE
ncbi:hypothetical protein BE221DRAFT_188331 [Ostreococcus tauri]|uniref:Uncharacterized protein n=1 Tax=Ostreococcus tauri TaxID=70448 RepID=A0A1Y5IHQ5_OSTTA|nr:hypothetical protein BE221DRAFT_188331 [Ostreococcus tauri]